MSFMFNPNSYNDPNPVNRPALPDQVADSVVTGLEPVAARIAAEVLAKRGRAAGPFALRLDGYTTAEWAPLVDALTAALRQHGMTVQAHDVAACYRTREELDALLADNLPRDIEEDPVLLFGKLFKGGYESLFDPAKLDALKGALKTDGDLHILFGAGACSAGLRDLGGLAVFCDVTPKQAVLRIKAGRYKNLGDAQPRPFRETMRRCYYYDFELAMHLRAEIIGQELADFYLATDQPDDPTLVPRGAFHQICAALVRYPFRCRPVYLEGVWGGHYLRRIRDLPETMKNCAWIFDLIPLEVSLLVQVGQTCLEIPFFTFVNREGPTLMGDECVRVFHGYFPIRFNYDDTFHSSGNMSVQLHPDGAYAMRHFGEHGRQDESYYVVATGHGARTYLGLRDGVDAAEFLAETRRSEQAGTPVDYQRFIHAVESKPGVQVMIPAGTVHASGRNQVVLEIGSLTVGSYTFKLYDYLRADLDGRPRPIHSVHGARALKTERTAAWVQANIVQEPRPLRAGAGWAEYAIGEHDLLYFGLYRYEFEKAIEGHTDGVFHVLSLVDGEHVRVRATADPSCCFEMRYLDIVVVPACIGGYTIENLGNQPVCIHKTCLRKDFAERANR